MKVYVLIISWNDEDGYCGANTYVFSSLEKAQEELKKQLKEYKEEGYYDTFEVDNMNISAYKEGEYLINHTDIQIQEQEVF